MTEENVDIKEISSEDELKEVLELLKELDESADIPLEKAESIWRAMASYPYYRIYAAYDEDNNIIGTFTLLICENLGHGGKPFAIVENVVVGPGRRGQGIGKAMMRKAARLAGEKGCYKLMLSSDIKREDAHRFYESIGFKRHGISYRIDI